MKNLIIDVKPTRLESAVVEDTLFDKSLDSLIKKGYEIISLPQNSQLRIQEREKAYISRNGNWTREGVLYIPKEKPKLVRNSPILESSKKATNAHRKDNEFYPTKKQIEKSLSDSIDFPEKTITVPTNRFDSEALTVYAFGGEKEAKAYGEFLREAGIKEMPVYAVDKDYINKQNKPFARQMWFGGTIFGSPLASHWKLNYVRRGRGVLDKSRGKNKK
ncbi:hypothetical protein JW949_04645 [Candidatus Woesearchaeota archaeon]|nr:hypothetical protein [Candidatus Woesearchaeota archaeon]